MKMTGSSVNIADFVPANTTALNLDEKQIAEKLSEKRLVTSGRFLLERGDYEYVSHESKAWEQKVIRKGNREEKALSILTIVVFKKDGEHYCTSLGALVASDADRNRYGAKDLPANQADLIKAIVAKGGIKVIGIEDVQVPTFEGGAVTGTKPGKIMKWDFR